MLNSVTLIGHVGQQPELKHVGKGEDTFAICNFTVATSKPVKGDNVTTWHNITTFRKTAESVEKYIKKGSKVAIQGEIENRTYEKDVNGTTVKMYATGIMANTVKFLDSKPKTEDTVSEDEIPF